MGHWFGRPRRLAASAIVLIGGLVIGPGTLRAQPDNEPGPSFATKRDAAREQFDRGVALVKNNALAAALAAFLRSREIFPSRAATSNAAWCLRKLERFDESLDMYEALLREFKNLPADERAAAQQAVAELRELLGTVEISGGVAGAAIAIDGRDRGEYPSVDALRVGAGTHVVRLYKEGYEPFETTVDVAGGQTARVRAHLARLAESGRLRVIERSGKHLDVILDNVRVGATPWEALVAVGPHTVVLRGESGVGTQPVRVPVQAQTTTPLTLAAEDLASSLLVQVTPPGASVALDGVPVGRGLWEGHLRASAHRVEVGAEGFLPDSREVTLAAGDRKTLVVELRRDPSAKIWKQPSKIVLDAALALDLPLVYGGDVEGGCGNGCSRAPDAGVLAFLHGSYELPSGVSFGLAVGYVRVAESLSGRVTSVRPVGLAPVAGTVSDELEVSGLLAGGTVGARFGARFPLTLRLGGGVFVGSARDQRQGSFGRGANAIDLAPALVSDDTRAVYVDPEARVSFHVTNAVELGVGVDVLALFLLATPKWDDKKLLSLGRDGAGTFPADSLAGEVLLVVAPGISARYAF